MNVFSDLKTIEADTQRLERIDKLQKAFQEVRETYRSEYHHSLNHAIGNIKAKMVQNRYMTDAVNSYVEKFVPKEKHDDAREELFNMLAAEFLQTLNTLQHTSCVLM